MLAESDLVIAQEYMPTDFDWRIGVLNGTPVFACKYFMAAGHWQIYNWGSGVPDDTTGLASTHAISSVPPEVLSTALKICSLIGNGLYGVDIKEPPGGGPPVVIEVNDNPNVDHGIEDAVCGDAVYLAVASVLRQRIEEKYYRGRTVGVVVPAAATGAGNSSSSSSSSSTCVLTETAR